MPHYFFDLHDGIDSRDHEGTILPGLSEAQAHALQVAAAYVGKPTESDSDSGAIVVTVRAERGERALVVRLAYHVEVG